MNRMLLPLLAVAFAAGGFDRDASASAMKSSGKTPLVNRKTLSEPLPLLPPILPSERDRLLSSFLTPNSIASQTILIETQPEFSRATLAASNPSAESVKPGTPLRVAIRPKPVEPNENAQFTLPEPASLLLLLTGLIGLTARRQMRKHHAKHA